jgi:adenylate kinase
MSDKASVQSGGVYIFLGPPASGKGTQAKLLSEKLKIPHVALGDILREAVRNETPLGLKAKSFMEAGNLVPDDLVISIASLRFKEADCKGGLIVDGYPRTLKQEASLQGDLRALKFALSAVVYIKISVEAAILRLSGRRSCKACGAVYHVKFNPPKVSGICDRCGSTLYQRHDDTEGVIKNRFKVYEKETVPLVEHFRAGNVLVEISGEGSVSEISKRILTSLSLN